jgi:hypothetical protein
MRSVAINIGANTNTPGFRGPIYAAGGFEYVPIPESEPTGETVPTYGDLDLRSVPTEHLDTPVHLDPEFATYPACEAYTYGDPFGVKASPLLELEAGDFVFFYATLSTADTDSVWWVAPEWGAYVIGHFRLDHDPVNGGTWDDLTEHERAPFRNNAHVKRQEFDARVMLSGDPWGSELYEIALPLSSHEAGATANRVVTDLSSDSGKGPWWRRPMKFGEEETQALLDIHDTREYERCFEG